MAKERVVDVAGPIPPAADRRDPGGPLNQSARHSGVDVEVVGHTAGRDELGVALHCVEEVADDSFELGCHLGVPLGGPSLLPAGLLWPLCLLWPDLGRA